tara:strand:- start:228 stop:1919 length:1692 start_codon:yes stop_codon:yes gene_type:complete
MSITVSSDIDNFLQAADNAAAIASLGLTGGGLVYQGTWNASTNTPTIPAAIASNMGFYYIVATAGTTSVDGEADWAINDWIISNGTAWSKIDNSEKTAAEIKTLYESNAETNPLTDSEKLQFTLPIADKETAYALTGVVAGTVYETADTGQIVEKLFTDGIAPLDQGDGVLLTNANADIGSSELLHLTGGTYREQAVSNPANPLQSFQTGLGWVSGDDDLEVIASFNIAYVEMQSYLHNQLYAIADSANAFMGGTAGKWGIGDQQYAGNILYESVEDSNTVHPADATWVALVDGVTVPTITRYSPVSWMLDGVIQTPTNDMKQQLTSLPNNREVNVFQEGGRIERYNGDNAGLATVFSISSAGSPTSSVSDGESSLALTYSVGASLDYEDSSGNAWVDYDGTRWTIGYQMYPFFRSAVCASSVHPADATGWEAYDAGGGIGLGTIADVTGVTALPEATESNWSDIIPTAEIILNDTVGSGSMSWNGSAVQGSTAVNYGWHQLDRPWAFTASNVESVTRDGNLTTGSLTGSGNSNGIYDHGSNNYTAMFNDNKKVRSITLTQGA